MSVGGHGPHVTACRTSGRALLRDAGGLSLQVAQVVQLRAPHAAAPHDLDALHGRRLVGEDALDADAARDLADGEGGAGAAAPPTDAHALERLDALLVTLADAVEHAERIA